MHCLLCGHSQVINYRCTLCHQIQPTLDSPVITRADRHQKAYLRWLKATIAAARFVAYIKPGTVGPMYIRSDPDQPGHVTLSFPGEPAPPLVIPARFDNLTETRCDGLDELDAYTPYLLPAFQACYTEVERELRR